MSKGKKCVLLDTGRRLFTVNIIVKVRDDALNPGRNRFIAVCSHVLNA